MALVNRRETFVSRRTIITSAAVTPAVAGAAAAPSVAGAQTVRKDGYVLRCQRTAVPTTGTQKQINNTLREGMEISSPSLKSTGIGPGSSTGRKEES
jgi:hypothetical protein